RIIRHKRNVTRNVDFQVDTPSHCLVRQEFARLGDDITQRFDRSCFRRLTKQSADAAYDVSRGVRITDDALGEDLSALNICWLDREPAMTGMGICDDCRQRLINLMRDRG